MVERSIDDGLIINSPYEEPKQYWAYSREEQQFKFREGRRSAGYWKASQNSKSYDDPGEFIEIDLVNRIRPRVRAWRDAGYPNTTGTTRKLLDYWRNPEQRADGKRFFFAQIEAVETAIWLAEASPAEKQGIEIPSDGSEWARICFKLATGVGKTNVMGMLIAWQALNKIANGKDTRFSRNILIVAPGITVRDRLCVLNPSDPENVYQSGNGFNIVPSTLWQELQSATIKVVNWHQLAPIDENSGPKVVKKGAESSEAFVRRVLPEFGNASGILVINDEAHHCHRPTEDDDEEKEEKEKATIWISGIDRINSARGVLTTYDLSATPFKPTGKVNKGELLFTWIVSDFGLNDAIESGLVKTPKIAVRDDSVNNNQSLRSKLFHIYPQVKDDLNRRAAKEEGLPDLLKNALNILATDWVKEKEDRESANFETPPVLIAVCNRTETAARVEHFISNGYVAVKELADPEKLLRIDQDALDQVENDTGDKSKKDLGLALREKVNTVGKKGKPGEQIQCVIGVNMLSEGWDARTVSHILGVRAFTSQLLCEQVVGRGLRRISYDVNEETGFFEPEYVVVFGVPFTFLPVEKEGAKPKKEKPKTKIEPLPDRADKEIRWCHVLRVERKLHYFLDVDWSKVNLLEISPDDCPTVVEIAPTIEGKPDYSMIEPINLDRLAESSRLQRLKLQASAQLVERFKGVWSGDPGHQIQQLMTLVDEFISSDKLKLHIPQFEGTEKLRNIVLALNLQKITNHIGHFISTSSKETPTLILDEVRPIRSTATSQTWYTSKPTEPVKKSQVSHIVVDSGWEKIGQEFERDRIPGLISWVKNDHLGFEIYYFWQGETRTYYPDFIIRFTDNRHIILEVKGQKTDQDEAKWVAAREWVEAVNADGNFGKWKFAVLDKPKELFEVVRWD